MQSPQNEPVTQRLLPAAPSIVHLKREAKRLRQGYRSMETSALARVQSSGANGRKLSHANALLVIAREYGFHSWPRLKAHVETLCLHRMEQKMPKQIEYPPNLESMEQLAKDLRNAVSNGDSDALARYHAYHPLGGADCNEEDARFSVAREYGFTSWRQLESFAVDPSASSSDFQHLACLTYFTRDHPRHREKAREMLAADPTLGTGDIWSAACVGDVEGVRQFLDESPELMNRRGGFFDWEPLLYACYSRLNLPEGSTLDVARLLLERGANPNAYFMWGGQYRFTALTGAFGEGEMGAENQPEHEDCDALAVLLLKAGAYPNDSQALYNRMFTQGSRCLEILLAYGLSDKDRANWLLEEDGELVEHPDQVLGYQLQWAVRNHHVDRAMLLIDHGADVTMPSGEGDLSFYEVAMLGGHYELAESLVTHGAERTDLDEVGLLESAIMALDRETAERLLAESPSMMQALQSRRPDLVTNVANQNMLNVVRLLSSLGADINRVGRRAPIHEACFRGHVEMVRQLVDLGADYQVRDLDHHGTPVQWASTAGQPDVLDYLSSLDLGLFDVIVLGDVSRFLSLLEADPTLLETTLGDTHDGERHAMDWQTPLAFAVLRDQVEIAKELLERGANVTVSSWDDVTLSKVAEGRVSSDMMALLEREMD